MARTRDGVVGAAGLPKNQAGRDADEWSRGGKRLHVQLLSNDNIYFPKPDSALS